MLRKWANRLFVVSVLSCVGILLVTQLLTELGVLPDTTATRTAEFQASQTAEQVQHAASSATAVVLALTPSVTSQSTATSIYTPVPMAVEIQERTTIYTLVPSRTATSSSTPTLAPNNSGRSQTALEEHQKQSQRTATIPTPTPPGPTTVTPTATTTQVIPIAANPQRANAQVAAVTRVIDGDTIEVSMDGQTYRVRYIGIDTPETGEPCGAEATAANTSFVAGQTVEMVKDVSETDRYGRLLRYVYVGDLFVNAVLVDQGFAEAVEYPPDTAYAALFEQLESEARVAGLGCHAAGVFEAGDTAPQDPPGPATETWYVTGAQRVNVRTCSSTDCAIITSVGYGEALTVVATASDWHEIRLPDGRTGYIAAWLTSSAQPPAASPTLPPAQPAAPRATAPPVQQEPAPRAAPPPTQPPVQQPAAPVWNCSGNLYNCPDFSSCGEMWSYWNACPGDPSGLDRDNDGLPCETQCGG